MHEPDPKRLLTASAVARVVGRWLVALVALLVATSFGALEVGGAHAYDDEGEGNVVRAAGAEAGTAAEEGSRDVPEERDDDEERDEGRDDDERTETIAPVRGAAGVDTDQHGLRAMGARVRRSSREERGERGAHARMIDRPPHT